MLRTICAGKARSNLLAAVEVYAADGAIMLLEALEQRAHSVVKNLHGAVVEGGGDPWALGVEGEALHAVAFGFELDEKGAVVGGHGWGGGGVEGVVGREGGGGGLFACVRGRR